MRSGIGYFLTLDAAYLDLPVGQAFLGQETHAVPSSNDGLGD